MGLIIKEILKIGTNRLEQAECPNPSVDAELLMCFMLGVDKTKLFMKWSDELPDKQCDYYFSLLETRALGMPLQYITGTQDFMGLTFEVDESVLIPRQDTEILVETAIDMLRKEGKKRKKILDLCCGSGAIAVSLDRYLNSKQFSEEKPLEVEITASDVSEEALRVARKNAAANGSKINFVCGDLFAPFKKKLGGKKFDMIVSNPPYIPTDVIGTLQREIRNYEPMIALDGGADGLKFYRQIIVQAGDCLSKEGVLVLEIGSEQADSVCTIGSECGFATAEVVMDLGGRDRVVIFKRN